MGHPDGKPQALEDCRTYRRNWEPRQLPTLQPPRLVFDGLNAYGSLVRRATSRQLRAWAGWRKSRDNPAEARQARRVTRTDMPTAWDERSTLNAMLDYARATVRAKCEGLSDEAARRSRLPTSPLTTISGLVSHLRWVEYSWFEVVLLGNEDNGPWTDEDPDREMRIALDVPLAVLLDEYDAQSERYCLLVADMDLDSRSRRTMSNGETVTLRFVLLHLIEETARHNGHLDILREMTDGVTGT